jgi:hypothetical protein
MKSRDAIPLSFVKPGICVLCLGLATLLLIGSVALANGAKAFRITSFVANTDGSASVQWEGATANIVIETTEDLANPTWKPIPGTEWPITGNSWTGTIPITEGENFIRVVSKLGAGTAPVPIKNVSLSMISWHDPQSQKFMRNCVACHGTRTQERALDGVTPTAHSLMLNFYGGGNDRCLTCHYNGPKYSGPDFLTHSGGALRKQVNYEVTGCTACHAKGSIKPLYDRY